MVLFALPVSLLFYPKELFEDRRKILNIQDERSNDCGKDLEKGSKGCDLEPKKRSIKGRYLSFILTVGEEKKIRSFTSSLSFGDW